MTLEDIWMYELRELGFPWAVESDAPPLALSRIPVAPISAFVPDTVAVALAPVAWIVARRIALASEQTPSPWLATRFGAAVRSVLLAWRQGPARWLQGRSASCPAGR